jgi:hypothetical protein
MVYVDNSFEFDVPYIVVSDELAAQLIIYLHQLVRLELHLIWLEQDGAVGVMAARYLMFT